MKINLHLGDYKMAYKIKKKKDLVDERYWHKSLEDKDLIRIVGGLTQEYYSRATRYGERAWRVHGKKFDLIVWDEGNSWYQIMKVLEHRKKRK